jgi:hypothetical protein
MPSRAQTRMNRLADRLYHKDVAHSQHERSLHLCCGLGSHCIKLVAHPNCQLRLHVARCILRRPQELGMLASEAPKFAIAASC